MKCKAETGHPVVLVLDNVNVLVDKDPKIVDILQDRAKEAVDNDLYKVVSVCSGGAAPVGECKC